MQRDVHLATVHAHLKKAYLLSDEKITQVLPGFFATLRNYLNELKKELDRGDYGSLQRAGHSLKGALLSLGLLDLAATFEQRSKEKDNNADYDSLFERLKEAIAEMVEH